MKLPKNILIEKACSGDAARAILNSAYLQKLENQIHPARLLATNGRILAVVPVLIGEHDSAGYVTQDALKAARKAAAKLNDMEFSCNSALTIKDGQTFSRPELGNYPNCDQVIPKDETVYSVSLDPELLLSLAEAIGASRGVTPEFIGQDKGFSCEALRESKGGKGQRRKCSLLA